MRICPKCGAYYAADSLAFCREDGTPLVNVEPNSESWNEGTRVIEKQTKALRKKTRRQKLRRVVVTSMSVTMITMIVSAAALNSWFYFQPSAVASQSPTPSPAPSQSPSPSPSPSLSPSTSPAPSPSPTPTPTPLRDMTPTPTPTPTPVRYTPTPTPTPTPVRYTPTPTPTPTPVRYTPTPTPTPTPVQYIPPTPGPTATPKPDCSDADQERAEQKVRSLEGSWRREIEGEQAKVIAQNAPVGVQSAEARLGQIEFQYAFPKRCKAAVVTASYTWQINYSIPGAPNKSKTVPRRRTFGCGKVLGMWVCH